LLAWYASWSVTHRIPEDRLMAFEAVVDEWEDQVRQLGEDATEKQQADVEAARAFIQFLRGNNQSERPRQLLDISDAVRHLAEISKIVERKERARAANAITYEQLKRFLFGISRVIELRVKDPELLAQIQSDILAVNV
jgi:predicted metalloendopeptidase